MCGAFSIRMNPSQIKFLQEVEPFRAWKPIYNARPSGFLPIVTQENKEKMTEAFWSFIPHWMKDPKGRGVINARAESIAEKPYFRSAVAQHRCIIPADGFYEWLRKGKIRQPYYFHRKDDKPFTFAGIYDALPDQTGNLGFAIITTEPNSLVAKVHNRMPVMLDEGQEHLWLNEKTLLPEALRLLDAYPADKMAAYPVSTKVNYAKEKGAEVVNPISG